MSFEEEDGELFYVCGRECPVYDTQFDPGGEYFKNDYLPCRFPNLEEVYQTLRLNLFSVAQQR